MKRVWRHVVVALSLIAGAGVVSSACVHNDTTLFVRDALLAQYRQNGMVCIYTPDPLQPFHSSGVLDIALKNQYDGVFLVGNQMVPQVNSSQLQTETSIVIVKGAIVRITDRTGAQLSTFTRLTTATLPPSNGGTPGYAPVFATIVDPPTIQNDQTIQQGIAQGQGGYVRLVTYVRFFGTSLGGQAVESNEFEFPVDVCNGCLINFTNNPSYPTPNCVGSPTATATTQAQIPCDTGQDVPIDCNACADIPNCRGAYQAVAPPPDAGGG
ncbi:MAG: hypothetical protein M3O46_11100 [Myxococcota bacterium]|nr:hypothetical protein [Myxococcota bacterium]